MTGTPPSPPSVPAARLRPMDGAAELAVAEAAAREASRPETVTAILSAAFETIGDDAATPETVRALPSATREWLLQRSASALGPETGAPGAQGFETRWFETRCEHCGEPYDIALDLSDPVYRAPDEAVSDVTVATRLGSRRFAVPCGTHEERLARLPADVDPRRAFAGLCGLSPDAAAEAEQFDTHDLELIEEALEVASPDIADEASIACPSCGRTTTCRIDPLLFAFPREADILAEIHLIAGAYGWSAGEILTLSARHRGRYADMIARERRSGQSRGMSQSGRRR